MALSPDQKETNRGVGHIFEFTALVLCGSFATICGVWAGNILVDPTERPVPWPLIVKFLVAAIAGLGGAIWFYRRIPSGATAAQTHPPAPTMVGISLMAAGAATLSLDAWHGWESGIRRDYLWSGFFALLLMLDVIRGGIHFQRRGGPVVPDHKLLLFMLVTVLALAWALLAEVPATQRMSYVMVGLVAGGGVAALLYLFRHRRPVHTSEHPGDPRA